MLPLDDDVEIIFRFFSISSVQYCGRSSVDDAVSSMEIDSSATDVNGSAIGSHKSMITSPDSYVSTSDSAEPTSRAQVLEELRARIRELEGSQLKLRPSHDEEHYKCYLCKVSAVIWQYSYIRIFVECDQSNLCPVRPLATRHQLLYLTHSNLMFQILDFSY